jgi:hypothetical protein
MTLSPFSRVLQPLQLGLVHGAVESDEPPGQTHQSFRRILLLGIIRIVRFQYLVGGPTFRRGLGASIEKACVEQVDDRESDLPWVVVEDVVVVHPTSSRHME